MNRTSDAIVADYALARALYRTLGRVNELETMNRLKAAAMILWPEFEIDLDLAADNYTADLHK